MYTQCPNCNTVFQVTIPQLRAGRGEIRCQHCKTPFDALAALADTVEDFGSDESRPTHPPAFKATESIRASRDDRTGVPPALGNGAAFVAASRKPSKHYADLWDDEPRVAPSESRDSIAASIAWTLGTLALVTILGFQLYTFEGSALAQNARIRPWLELACETVACRLPEYRDLTNIHVVSRALRPAADDIDGFEFNLVITNEAGLPQAFPSIKLSLADVAGRTVASRIFKPKEYLEPDQPSLMPVGKPFQIRLVLARPTQEVGGFTFDLI